MKKRFQHSDKPEKRFNKSKNNRTGSDRPKSYDDRYKKDRPKEDSGREGFKTNRFKSDKYKDDKPRYGADRPKKYGDKPERFKNARSNDDRKVGREDFKPSRFKSDRFKDDKPRYGSDRHKSFGDGPRKFNNERPGDDGRGERSGKEEYKSNRFKSDKYRDDRPRYGTDRAKSFEDKTKRFKNERPSDDTRGERSEKEDYKSNRFKSNKYRDDKPRYGANRGKSFEDKPRRFKNERPSDDSRGGRTGSDDSKPNRFQSNRPNKYNSDKPRSSRFDDERPKRKWADKSADRGRPEPPDYRFNEDERSKKGSLDTRIKKSSEGFDKDEIRLNRYIANAGICSRREADTLIEKGLIQVNGQVVTELGTKIKKTDTILYNDKVLNPEKPVYVLLNKPKDFITTLEDPEDRKTVMQLVASACDERIFPVGRLDRNTTGLLLLTNDGELADKLAHPSGNIKKVYQVDLDKPISTEDIEKISKGVELEDGEALVDSIVVVTPDAKSLGIELHIGKNRIVRRIFESLGYEVLRLDRVMYAGLTKKDLPRGRWRYLTEQEVVRLKHFIK